MENTSIYNAKINYSLLGILTTCFTMSYKTDFSRS